MHSCQTPPPAFMSDPSPCTHVRPLPLPSCQTPPPALMSGPSPCLGPAQWEAMHYLHRMSSPRRPGRNPTGWTVEALWQRSTNGGQHQHTSRHDSYCRAISAKHAKSAGRDNFIAKKLSLRLKQSIGKKRGQGYEYAPD